MPSTAKLFMNGRSQAVRLPSEFRFEGTEVAIRKDAKTGDVILSRKPASWEDFFAMRDALSEKERAGFQVPRSSKPLKPRKIF